MGEVYAKCCGDIFKDETEINTEIRGKNDAKTIDMDGYGNKIEMEYDGFLCTYSTDNGGSFDIGIKAKANDNKWSKLFSSTDYNDDLKEMHQKISEARDDDTIKAYMYEDNPSFHASVGQSNVMQDYPLLMNIDDKFTFLLPRAGDVTKYIINGDKKNLKLIEKDS